MRGHFLNRLFLPIFIIICLGWGLLLPKYSQAEDFTKINIEDFGQYLELPPRDIENLLWTLIQVFSNDWINREAEICSTPEERLIPLILRKAERIDALNHLLVDAPIRIISKITKSAIDIARLFLAEDVSVILKDLEKKSVEKATEYAMSVLLQNNIRINPGTMEFKYVSQKGNKEKVVFQYVVVYQAKGNNIGKTKIRIYSIDTIEPPKAKRSLGGMMGIPYDFNGTIPPFIVEINGEIKNYLNWLEQPQVEISFPENVPDLGIEPLSFWEKYLLKPITDKIKGIKITITDITEGSVEEIISKISELFSKINPFGQEASVVQQVVNSPVQYEEPFVEDYPQDEITSEIGVLPVSKQDYISEEIDFSESEPESINQKEDKEEGRINSEIELLPQAEDKKEPDPDYEEDNKKEDNTRFLGGGSSGGRNINNESQNSQEVVETENDNVIVDTPLLAPKIILPNSGDIFKMNDDLSTSTEGFQINLAGTSTPEYSIFISINSTSTLISEYCPETGQDGYWNQMINLEEGINEINAKAQDKEGNQSATTSISVTLDSTIDDIPPSAITDLSAEPGKQTGSINLTWTAPGDDGLVGTSTKYILRYATSSIDNDNWHLAFDVNDEPLPAVSGIAENLIVAGLEANQTYYWAIKSQDEAGNISQISNCSSSKTGVLANNIVISELAAEGPNGSKDEFIELYNPTDNKISLNNWSIQYASAQATSTWYYRYFQYDEDYAKYLPGIEIDSHGYLLLTSATTSDGYSYGMQPDLIRVTSKGEPTYLGFANKEGKVRLLNNGGEIVDLVAWGEDTLGAKGKPILTNSFSWGSLERKADEQSDSDLLAVNGSHHWLGNSYNTNNNNQDFVLQNYPNPQNSLSLTEPRDNFPGLAESDWPTYQHDLQRTGKSIYSVLPDFSASTTPSTTPKWEINLKEEINHSYPSSPIIGPDGSIYLGTDKGICKIKSDGSIDVLWEHGEQYLTINTPTISSDGTIYATGLHFIYAISKDGNLIWKQPIDYPSLPALAKEGLIYVGADPDIYSKNPANLYAFNLNGEIVWQKLLSDKKIRTPSIGLNNIIYAVANNYLFAVNTQNGNILWQTEDDFFAPPSIGNNLIFAAGYLTLGNSGLHAVNADSGMEMWYVKTNDTASSIAAIDGNLIYISSSLGTLFSIDVDSEMISENIKTAEWRIDKSISDASPVVDNSGIIYIGSWNGMFYAVNPDGDIKWQSRLDGSPINYSAAIDRQGIIYIASRDGYLYAFGK